jgi:UDP-glucose 4-epimerase
LAYSSAKVLITGGAGLVGSHIASHMVKTGHDVTVLDNLKSGSVDNIRHLLGKKGFKFVNFDVVKLEGQVRAVRDCDVVFHCASVRRGKGEENVAATKGLLGALAEAGAKLLFLRSTALVYGNALVIPTPEDYSPLKPTTPFASSKLECERLIAEFGATHGCTTVIARFANIVGGRSFHGVVRDYVERLRNDPTRLRVLGDGYQVRSYVHIDDVVAAVDALVEHATEGTQVYNVGAKDAMNMYGVAKTISEEMGLPQPEYISTGSYSSGGAWPGDPRIVFPDTQKITALGWGAGLRSREAVKKATIEALSFVQPPGRPAKDASEHWSRYMRGSPVASE